MRKSLLFILFASSVAAFISCAPAKPAKEKTEFFADRIMVKLEANRRKVKTFSGSGVMNINSPQLEVKATFEVKIKKPDSIKVNITGPFGIEVMEAVVTKRDFKFFDVLHNRVYTGRNRAGLIEKIFKVNFSFDDLMDAFAGAVELSENLRKIPDDYEDRSAKYIFTYSDRKSGKKTLYEIQKSDLSITQYQLFGKQNDLLFEGKYSDFRNFNDVPIPYEINVSNAADGQQIKIEYRKIEVNKELSGLSLATPRDVEIVEW